MVAETLKLPLLEITMSSLQISRRSPATARFGRTTRAPRGYQVRVVSRELTGNGWATTTPVPVRQGDAYTFRLTARRRAATFSFPPTTALPTPELIPLTIRLRWWTR